MSMGVTPHPRTASLQRQIDALEAPANVVRALDIAPQREARRARVRDGDVHPAVLVVVEHGNADGGGQLASS